MTNELELPEGMYEVFSGHAHVRLRRRTLLRYKWRRLWMGKRRRALQDALDADLIQRFLHGDMDSHATSDP